MKVDNGFVGVEFTPQNWQNRCNRAATEKELAWQSEIGKRELVDMHARQQAQLDKLRQGNWKGKEARLVSLQNALHAQHAAEAAAIREKHVTEITALKRIQGPGSQRLTPTKDIRDFKGKTFSSKDGKERVTAYREKWSIRNSFVDDGKSVTVLKDNDPKAILAAMQLTLQKYGAIHVQGNEDFKKLCATIAARNGLQIANQELQVITETERRRISEAIQQRTAASGQQRQDPAPSRPATAGMGPGREVPASTPERAPQATPAAAQAQEQAARHTAESVKATAAEIARGRAMMLSRHELEKLDTMREAQAVGRAQAWPRPITDTHTQQALDRLYEQHAQEASAFTDQWGVDPYLHLDQAYVREQEALQARHDAALVVDVANLRAMLDRRGVEAEGINEAAKLKEQELRDRYALETAALQLSHSQSPAIQQARTAAGIDTSIPQERPQAQTAPGMGRETPAQTPQPVAMAATANPDRPLVPAVQTSYSSDPFLGDAFGSSGESAMTETALRAAAQKAGFPDGHVQELEDAGKLIRVEDRDGVTKFTTPEIRDMETRLVGTAEAMAGKTFYGVPERVADEVATHYTLSDEQREVFNHIRNGNHSCAVVRGLAGTGKSHTMKAVNEACERSGIKVIGCAPSGIVAEDMQKGANIESFTNHALLGRIESGEIPLNDHTMVIMDEAGMTDSVRMARIIENCYRNNSKFVLVGDAEQLQPVGLGGPMRSIQERIGYAELTEIRRQKSEVDREMVRRLSEKDAAGAIELMEQRGQIATHKHEEGVMRGVADGYVADVKAGKTVLALASQITQVTELNTVLRERMQKEGLVNTDEYPFRAQNKNGMYNTTFAKGDRIICGKNDYKVDVRNGSVGTVDRAENGKIWVRMDSDKESIKLLKQSEYPNIEHAYAMTVHKSQGKTVDSVHYAFGNFCNCNIAYVAASRHKESFQLHCTEGQRTKLEAAFMKDNSKDTVADYAIIQRPEPQVQQQAQTKAMPEQPQTAGIQAPGAMDPRIEAPQTQAPQQDTGSRVPAEGYTPEAVAAQQMPTIEAPVPEQVRETPAPAQPAQEADSRTQEPEQAPQGQEMAQDLPEAATTPQAGAQEHDFVELPMDEPIQQPAAPEQVEASTPEQAPQQPEFIDLDEIHGKPELPDNALGKVDAGRPQPEPQQAPEQEKETSSVSSTAANAIVPGAGMVMGGGKEEPAPAPEPEQKTAADKYPDLPENALGKLGQTPTPQEAQTQVQDQGRPQLPENHLGRVDTGGPKQALEAPEQGQSREGRPELPPNALGQATAQGGPQQAPPEQQREQQQQGYGYV